MPSDPSLSREELEQGSTFAPRFDADGLIPAIVVDASDSAVLVLAYMNRESLRLTLQTGTVHFWSRSRGKIWMKGESSGHVLNVEEMRVDCDQDALLIRARPDGPTCHTGEKSCFYRRVDNEGPESSLLVKVKT